MDISLDLLKKLREETSAGVMECKRALQECQGDMPKAVALLNEQGLAKAAKKLERVALQGVQGGGVVNQRLA